MRTVFAQVPTLKFRHILSGQPRFSNLTRFFFVFRDCISSRVTSALRRSLAPVRERKRYESLGILSTFGRTDRTSYRDARLLRISCSSSRHARVDALPRNIKESSQNSTDLGRRKFWRRSFLNRWHNDDRRRISSHNFRG